MTKNVFTYWEGEKNPVVEILEKRLRAICKENGYCLYEIDENSIRDYISLPEEIKNIHHIVDITDFYRIKLLSKYGGIWLDKDVLVFRSLDEYFEINKTHGGFVVATPTLKRYYFNNAILGAAQNSAFYKKWEENNTRLILDGGRKFCQLPFGNNFLNKNSEDIRTFDIEIIDGIKTKIDPFVGNISQRLFSLDSLDKLRKDNPALIHFFNKNCKKFLSMTKEQQSKTMMFHLLNDYQPS